MSNELQKEQPKKRKSMRRKIKYKHICERVVFSNRWKKLILDRGQSWVIFGLSKDFFSPTEYEYRISFFGFDIRIWMIRERVINQPNQ